jgi:hypothetical protein
MHRAAFCPTIGPVTVVTVSLSPAAPPPVASRSTPNPTVYFGRRAAAATATITTTTAALAIITPPTHLNSHSCIRNSQLTLASAPAPASASARSIEQLGVIPARYASTRFPGKPLVMIAGKPMIVRTYLQAAKEGPARLLLLARLATS